MTRLHFNFDGSKVTGTFEEWQIAMDVFSDVSIFLDDRERAKDGMVCLQHIIIACRGARKYQRDTIPPETDITVTFQANEWMVARETLLAMNAEWARS